MAAKEKKRVQDATTWFLANRPVCTNGAQAAEFFENVLSKTDFKPKNQIKFLVQLMLISFNKVTPVIHDMPAWSATLYIYDASKNFTVLFHNNQYYIDVYGNCYPAAHLTHNEVLQILGTLCNASSFKAYNDQIYHIPPNIDILLLIQRCLHSFGHEISFLNFRADCNGLQDVATTLIKELKAFFVLFMMLDTFEKANAHRLRIFYEIQNDKKEMRIIFPNFDKYDITTKTFIIDFTELNNKLQNLNLNTVMESFSYLISTSHMDFISDKYDMKKHQDTINDILKIKYNKSFRNTLHFIASKIFKRLKDNNFYGQGFKMQSLTSLITWLAVKYKDETSAIMDIKTNGFNVVNEFETLFQAVINCNKSALHIFKSNYSAAYHFEKHYNEISNKYFTNRVFRSDFPYVIPPLMTMNLQTDCLPIYLQHLPDALFTGNYNIEPAKEEDALMQTMHFEKWEIKGIKEKQMNTAVLKASGNTTTDPLWHEDTFIRTIFSKN